MRAKPSRHARFFYPVASSHAEFTRPFVYAQSKVDWQRPWEQTRNAIKKDVCFLVWAHPRADPPSEPEFSDIFINNPVLRGEAERGERSALRHKPGLGRTECGSKQKNRRSFHQVRR